MAYYIDDAKKTAIKGDGKSVYGWNRETWLFDLPETDSFYEFEPVPAEGAEELMTYELTIPYKERNRFEEILRKVGFPVSALKKVVNNAAVF